MLKVYVMLTCGTYRVEESVLEALKVRAAREGVTPSWLVSRLIASCLVASGDLECIPERKQRRGRPRKSKKKGVC